MIDPRLPRRNLGIEGLRFVAALGIVWFHMQAPGQPFAYAALAVFLVLTADLSAGSLERGGTAAFLRGRVTRVLVPWLAWSGFYLALLIARGADLPDFAGDWRAVLIGPEIHLWFLPFVFLASVLVLAAQAWVSFARSLTVVLVAAVAGAALSLVAHNWANLPEPFAQWSFALPPFLLGLVMAHARRSGQDWAEPAFMFAVLGIALAAGATEGVLQLLIAWPVLWLVWRLPVRAAWLAPLGALSFGIYLIHPFFALVMFKFAPALEATLPGVVLVFAASALTVAILQRIPLLRRLV